MNTENKNEHETPQLRDRRIVDGVTSKLSRAAAGDLALLRRSSAGGCPPTFYRLFGGLLDEALPPAGQYRDDQDERWLKVCILLAHLLHGDALADRPRSLGEAMARSNVSEARVLRLLQAQGDALFTALRAITHQLVASGQSCAANDVAQLILSDGRSWEQASRRSIARDYYRYQAETEN